MSSLRTLNTLYEWLELDYFRRPRPLKSLWRPVVVGTFLLATAVMIGLAIMNKVMSPHVAAVFQAGPLSAGHSLFNNDCGKCHVGNLQTLNRLVRFDPTIHSVPDSACLSCHAAQAHNTKMAEQTACVSCHREHHGLKRLVQVADAACTNCHGNLSAALAPGQTTTFRDVARWADHPTFAHRWEGAPGDPGTVAFNHAAHLDPTGIPVLHDPAGKGGEDRRSRRKVLQCKDCHAPDEAGRQMKPIRYDAHCASCHPLTVTLPIKADAEAARQALTRFSHTPAPHQAPEAVRAALRDRLTQLIKATPALLGQPGETATPTRPIPGSKSDTGPARPETVSREEFDWVGRQLIEVEKPLFGSKSQSGCGYCHQRIEATNPGEGELPRFAPSLINERTFPDLGVRNQWFPHNRFHHESHRMISCSECHPASASRRTSDVLLPSIDTCRQCHSGKAGATARTDCVECHTYHPGGGKLEFHGRLTIDEALGKQAPGK
jgi:hypothetical protein